MGLLREMGAAAIMIPVLVAVFFAVGTIFFVTMLFRRVSALGRLRGPAVVLGSLAATAIVTVGLTYYLTRLATEDAATLEGLKVARNAVAQKDAAIQAQKKEIARMRAQIDAASSRESELADARKRVADLEKTIQEQGDDLQEGKARLDATLRFVSRDKIAPVVSADGKLTDSQIQSLAGLRASIVRPRLWRSRVVITCPMKYVTAGSTFTLTAGKESFEPVKIVFDADNWLMTLTFHGVATAEEAMRFTRSDEMTLVIDNKANPCHIEAAFTRGATVAGWFSSTTDLSLSTLKIGQTRIAKTPDGWRAETGATPVSGRISNFLESLWDKL